MGMMLVCYVIMFLSMFLAAPFFIVYWIYSTWKDAKIHKYIEQGEYDKANKLIFGYREF